LNRRDKQPGGLFRQLAVGVNGAQNTHAIVTNRRDPSSVKVIRSVGNDNRRTGNFTAIILGKRQNLPMIV